MWVDTRLMRRLAALSLLAIVGATACGGDDDGGGSATTAGGGGADVTTGASSIAPPPTEPGGADTVTDETATNATDTGDTSSGGSEPDGTTPGGGSVGEDEGAYVDALMAEYSGSHEDVARCIAEALVGGAGLEQLQSKDVTPDELANSGGFQGVEVTLDDPAATAQAVQDCGDGYLVFALAEVEDTADARACADEHLSDELVARLVVASSVGEGATQEDQDAASAFDDCLQGN